MVRRGEDRLSAEEEAALIYAVQSQSPQADDAFVRLASALKGLVHSIARKVGAKFYADANTLLSLEVHGFIGLAEAIRDFDPSKGARLSTYAFAKIRRRVLDAVRAMVKPAIKTVSLSEPVGRDGHDDGDELTYEDTVPDDSPVHDVRECVDCALLTPQLEGHLQSLTPRQRQVIHCRYWQQQTPAEISRTLGITRVRVGQLLDESLTRLRKVMLGNVEFGLN